jgi:hypothetical protein
MSIYLRRYSEATMARSASNADCGQRELHNAGHGVAIARAPHPALGRHGIALQNFFGAFGGSATILLNQGVTKKVVA